jgi:protein phosphatase
MIRPSRVVLLPDSSFFAISEKGGREVNEDSISARSVGDRLVFGVADGLGGHARGEVASRIAIAELDRIDATALPSCDPESLLREVFTKANAEITRYNREQGVNSGTTLTACIVSPEGISTIGNIGDSRAYVIDQESCWHTRDHSYLQQLIDSGSLTEREVIRHPQSNIITRALGLERVGVPDLCSMNLDGKVLVLTSDGIHDFIEPDRFRELAMTPGNREAALALIDAAIFGGSTDNLSVIVCRI